MSVLAGIEQEALELLEWPRVAAHLASFASTSAGQRHCRLLPLGADPASSQRLLAETTELLSLDGLTDGGLNFQGAADIASTVAHCATVGSA